MADPVAKIAELPQTPEIQQAYEALLAAIRKEFNEDEPRDDHGRWTSGGESGDAQPTTATSSGKNWINEEDSSASAEFNDKINNAINDLPEGLRNLLATNEYQVRTIASSKRFTGMTDNNQQIIMVSARAADRDNSDPAKTIRHEIGHAIDGTRGDSDAATRLRAYGPQEYASESKEFIAATYADLEGGNDKALKAAGLGHYVENSHELFAELSAALLPHSYADAPLTQAGHRELLARAPKSAKFVSEFLKTKGLL